LAGFGGALAGSGLALDGQNITLAAAKFSLGNAEFSWENAALSLEISAFLTSNAQALVPREGLVEKRLPQRHKGRKGIGPVIYHFVFYSPFFLIIEGPRSWTSRPLRLCEKAFFTTASPRSLRKRPIIPRKK